MRLFDNHENAGERLASRRARRRKLYAGIAMSLAASMALAPAAVATDTMPWGNFNDAWAAGENQPYQHGYTGLDILNWDPAKDRDSQYLRSRVPLQPRIAANSATQKDPSLSPDTQMATIAGDYGNAFFESFHDNNVFSQYLFNYWQYTDIYGTWHGQATQDMDKGLYDQLAQSDWQQKWFEFGTLNLPNAAYTNAAHKNGAKSIATIFFSDNDRGEQTYRDLLQGKRDDGTYPVADKLVEIAKYYGFDGYFINQESNVSADDVSAYQDFMKQIVDQGIYIQWYDAATYPNGGIGYQNQFNSSNSPWVQDSEKGRISDSIFLNYWYNGDMLKSSAEHARSLGLDPKQTVFAGIEAGQKKFGSISANTSYMDANKSADGTYVSLAALGADFVSHELGDDKKVKPEYQNEVFDRERRLWTGSSTGEKGTTDIKDGYIDDGNGDNDGWKGFASQITERSVIGGTVFSTSFNTGHGLEWRDGGKQTSAEEWGNINLQDILPTWQWWIDADSDPLQADFDYGEQYTAAPRFSYQKIGAYEGGDSLVLSGKLSSDNTMRLYKTDLEVRNGSKIDLTYNKPTSDDSKLQLGLIFADDTSAVVPIDVADGEKSDGWATASVDLSEYAGKHIATIGLIVKAGAQPIDDYQINIGKLTLTDGGDYTPATPANLKVEHVYPNTQEATVTWDIADYAQVKNYLLYLDDTFIGGRYDDTLYIKKLPAKSGTLKLYAVGADGTRSLAAETSLNENAGVANLKAAADKDGTLKVTWDDGSAAGGKTVTVTSQNGSWRYGGHPYVASVNVPAAATEVTIGNVPVDGSKFVVSVAADDGTQSDVSGSFADATLEPYPLCSVIWNDNGDQVTLVRPQTQDWRYIYMTEKWTDENGEPQERQIGSRYTYNPSSAPITGIIRGRSTPGSYTVSVPSGHELWVSYEDYNGNTSDPVKVPSKDELASCVAADPTLPDARKSSVEVVDGEAVADGKSPRTVIARVKDSFGNPLNGVTVDFELPDGLAAADGNTSVTTGGNGTSTLQVTTSKAGTYKVKASLDGVAIGEGEIEFAKVPVDRTKLQKTVDEASKLDRKQYTEDSWNAFASALDEARKVLANTDANQEQVNVAADKLSQAMSSLVKVSEPGNPGNPDDPNKPNEETGQAKPGDASHGLASSGSAVLAIAGAAALLLLSGFTVLALRTRRRD